MLKKNVDPLLRIKTAGQQAVLETKEGILLWINSSSFQELISVFEWRDDLNQPLLARINNLVEQSNEWDFRRLTAKKESIGAGNQESTRWTSSSELLSNIQSETVIRVARQLQLTKASSPLKDNYRAILVLGGARLSCFLRSKRAAEIVQKGVSTNEIALLGSERIVSDSERDATNTYAINAKTEFDLFVAAGANIFGFDPSSYKGNRNNDPNPHLSWEIREYTTNLIPPVVIISAPSSDPMKRRSNSADTYKFYIERYHLIAGNSLLLITSQIYVPYQQLEAIRVITVPLGIHVETVGFPPEWNSELQGMQGPQHYLQEIRSFLQSSQRFLTTYLGK